jgi:hypothetical protein
LRVLAALERDIGGGLQRLGGRGGVRTSVCCHELDMWKGKEKGKWSGGRKREGGGGDRGTYLVERKAWIARDGEVIV